MKAPEIKYTDRDVRENNELKLIALSYLERYGGEFDPLIRAQNMLAMDGDLTTVMVRTVLNCMRHDENVASQLPQPKGYTMPESPGGRASGPFNRAAKRREPPRQPMMLTLGNLEYRARSQIYTYNFRLKFDYVMNLHKRARWYHQIDHSATLAYYYPAGWWEVYHEHSIVLHTVRGMCGKNLNAQRWATQPHIVLGDQIDAEDSGNEFCPRCQYGHRDAGWKP